MSPRLRNGLLMAVMVAAAGMAWALTPRERMSDQSAPLELASVVPTRFGEWTEVDAPPSAVIDPGRQQVIDKIYADTLTRVYVNPDRYAVMLSIAYGRNQSDSFQLHQPEVCYPAQGFNVLERSTGTLQMNGHAVPITRLNTRGPRTEPLTYWSVIGNHAFQGGINKKLTEMRYGLAGKIPDGMLVRVSSIDTQTAQAHAIQARFATELAAALPEAVRARFVGAAAP